MRLEVENGISLSEKAKIKNEYTDMGIFILFHLKYYYPVYVKNISAEDFFHKSKSTHNSLYADIQYE